MKKNACIIISAVMMGMTMLPQTGCVLPDLSATAEAASVKLPAPTGMQTDIGYKSGSHTITLTWNKVKGADGYQVYVFDEKKGRFVAYKKVKGTTALYRDADPTVTYRFKVAAYKKASSGITLGELSRTFIFELTEEAIDEPVDEVGHVPADGLENVPVDGLEDVPTAEEALELEAPKNIRLEKATADSITLKWNMVQGADRYYVEYFSDDYRREAEKEDVDFVRDEVSTDTNSITVKDLEPDEKYIFIVYAAGNKHGKEISGKRSEEKAFSTKGDISKPSSPSSVKFSYLSGKFGVISWNSPENTASFVYEVYEGNKCLVSERTTKTSAALTKLEKDKLYTFRVAAVNKKGTSAYYQCTFSTAAQKDRLPDPEAYGFVQKNDFPYFDGNLVFGKTYTADEFKAILIEDVMPDYDYVKHIFDNGLKPKKNEREAVDTAELPNLSVSKIVICRDGKDLYEYYTCFYFKDREHVELRLVIKVL